MTEQYTKEEMREMFLEQARALAFYWSRQNGHPIDLIEGAMFSLLNVFDGMSGGFPCAIDLVLRPHPDDKEFHISEGEKWVEDGMCINDDVMLHEMFYERD
jgi:hypothetical protein